MTIWEQITKKDSFCVRRKVATVKNAHKIHILPKFQHILAKTRQNCDYLPEFRPFRIPRLLLERVPSMKAIYFSMLLGIALMFI